MSNSIINIHNLSKRYRIGAAEKGYKTFREAIIEGFTAPIKNFNKLRNLTRFTNEVEEDTIWALKDVSFSVKEGEVLAIIGKNGSGKSTLLKILSRITEPTTGFAEINGRISSLLEVGTGFHPELTGRENIFLNGGILGMRKKEIEAKFDDIVSFSEIGKFIDTPVKRYSSGMYVRLAFAVAAHLEPEILLVDEVLAVGDAQFQKKCLGKMGDLAGGGRTVLFVSHNMSAVKSICQRAILLSEGTIAEDGPIEQVTKHYLSIGTQTSAERKWDDSKSAPGDDVVRLLAVRAKNAAGEVCRIFNIQEPIYIEIEFQVIQEGWILECAMYPYDEYGLQIFGSMNNLDPVWHSKKRAVGVYRDTCCIPGNLMNDGTLTIQVSVRTNTDPNISHATERNAVSFQIFDPGSGGVRGDIATEWPGVIRPLLNWKTEFVQDADNNSDNRPHAGDSVL